MVAPPSFNLEDMKSRMQKSVAALKDEGIALGVDQIRRYHVETPEVMVP